VSPVIDPSFLTKGAEWQIGGVDGSAKKPSSDFGAVLGQSLNSLQTLQSNAADASQALATGQASDPTQVVMAVERAQLAMQLAGQLRNKGVEAVNDILHTQV
jgi:flagellar hook-basal body complex protein FliE